MHNIRAKTPLKNIIALIDALHEFNGTKWSTRTEPEFPGVWLGKQ
jgi:hypothetical protein